MLGFRYELFKDRNKDVPRILLNEIIIMGSFLGFVMGAIMRVNGSTHHPPYDDYPHTPGYDRTAGIGLLSAFGPIFALSASYAAGFDFNGVASASADAVSHAATKACSFFKSPSDQAQEIQPLCSVVTQGI